MIQFVRCIEQYIVTRGMVDLHMCSSRFQVVGQAYGGGSRFEPIERIVCCLGCPWGVARYDRKGDEGVRVASRKCGGAVIGEERKNNQHRNSIHRLK